MKKFAVKLALFLIVATQLLGCRSITSKMLRCDNTECCSYDVELKPPESSAELSGNRKTGYSDDHASGYDNLKIDLSDIEIMSQYSSVGITNIGIKSITFQLSNKLIAKDKVYFPINAKVRTEFNLVNKLPDVVRKMPIGLSLKPGEIVVVSYVFPLAVVEQKQFIQKVVIDESQDNVATERELFLFERAYSCLFGNGYEWRPVEGEVATDLSIYDKREAKLKREQARASK